ncbi:lipopolysaccharide assembly protein LapA domain-containing protein [Nocardioides aequoreus]|uniref:lipopolysaccharide assembly protein LapA domain-containing protein n=1 Tax=Nocardioides aequoreus TaxID=397278 RepID=UPI001B80CCFE|nr:lipopolysaccharide assembly protein LapA domain-containing protein [Nocardioides aequoreus]
MSNEQTPPPADSPQEQAPPSGAKRTAGDPLRGSRTSGIWVAVLALVVVVILLAVFILQNTQTAEVRFLGWTGTAPVSATLLIAAAGGALLVAAAGALRILQLRRRVKRERKRA